MIKPTVGRIVHYFNPRMAPTEMAATVCAVHPDGTVNLNVLDQNGDSHPKRSVYLVQLSDPSPAEGIYCAWMPYQIEQSAKQEPSQAVFAQSEPSTQKFQDGANDALPEIKTIE